MPELRVKKPMYSNHKSSHALETRSCVGVNAMLVEPSTEDDAGLKTDC